ncbi:DUF4347 domain-containing protein [Aromatoleum anaerobium]|uniref:DUF4347 domain-containing protein n=2 Tax=Aromatoleum TaxID=551759 RepID=A0ABX1PQF6_9RHOO|nr:DUF4347 domain-containing protein [Aromatoleum anaerobium]MCK0505535.1 DUF4347 domain-containing protein [Aromatoleum anaerobium]
MTKNIVFIDSRVADFQALIAGLSADTEWVLLEASEDGLAQMQAALAGYSGLDSIQIVSHGAAGTVHLGATALDQSTLGNYQMPLQAIGQALSASGDLLLYGCNVAAGSTGEAFIAALAAATGADVAASNDLTGAGALGGDWVLERTTGNIEVSGLQGSDRAGLLAANTAPTFTVADGKVTTDFGSDDYGNGVSVQADGKILVAGSSSSGFALVRYNIDGNLDTSFASDGTVTTDFGWYSGEGRSVSVQADGKILVAGTSGGDFALVRYNPDGSLDTSFDSDGTVTTNLGWYGDEGRSVSVQADGKILVAGSSNGNFALVRYNTDGSLDANFDGDGTVTTDLGFYDDGNSLAVQADGKILVAGSSSGDFALVRYNPDGSLDTSFDSDGTVTTDLGWYGDEGRSVSVQADGKILVAGSSGGKTALARYNTDGKLDTSFSGDGKVTTNLGEGRSVTLQADGKILVAGSSNGNFALARYNTDGSLDTSFDNDGMLTTSFDPYSGEGRSVTVQADGKILVAGSNNGDLALARYNTDGSLDTTFSPPENTLAASPTYRESYGSGHDSYYYISPVVLDPGVHILDGELATAGNYNGATLTLTRHGGASGEDVFSAASGGTLSTLLSGSYFAIDSVTIGRVTTNGAGTLTLAFNANATQARVDAAMQQIAYVNTSDAPPATVQIDWTFSDGNTGSQGTGGALSISGSTTVQISPRNDAPQLVAPMPDQIGAVDIPFNYTLPAGTFNDPDREALSYKISMVNGTGLPPWLSFNAATRSLTGTPGAGDTGAFELLMTATDGEGASVYDTFRVIVDREASGTLTVTGAAQEGGRLTASLTNVSDVDGLTGTGYQWQVSGDGASGWSDLNGATGPSYSIAADQSQVGKHLRVVATTTDTLGGTTTFTGEPSAKVANVNDAPSGSVTITGTARLGQTLTATNKLVDSDGLGTISYQWQAAGSNISGATGSTLLLGQAQVGKAITVVASYTDGMGTAESKASVATAAVTNASGLPVINTAPTFTVRDGKVTTDFGASSFDDGAYSVAVQDDGTILMAGSSNGDFALSRYNPDGSLDTSFASDGRVTTDLGFYYGDYGGRSMAVQADSKILVAGSSVGDFALVFSCVNTR